MCIAIIALLVAYCLGAALGFLAGKDHEWERLKRDLSASVDFID